MLGDKYRMATHWCLFAVVSRLRWCKTLRNKIGGMGQNDRESASVEICELSSAQPES
ncbi:hypothetical protein BV98_001332 [Sphingobium herbicidovorans NBRC 16415]|uniref:Uncharacterized protein n=1 Tax=Sphingobium herbicidovorans (strain ATCC 700291 / DSM 11019 / CCUG 56400 / KCTC 2939 / LMG 18315 / NBRC 16415 / MH) TaxID=1219045 RepID=A0A086PBN3_SPHHM|nr:hypothetical protein BV98_001332 [Sphingobium herbicidovorans NBRC 16415]